VNLGAVVNSSAGDARPSISADGLTLFFHSQRSGGFGSGDLWMTTRASEFDPWELPENLGSAVNSSVWEGAPSISADGLTLFFATGGEIYMTTRASLSDPWETRASLGPTVNITSNEGTPNISADGWTLFFDSDRPGGSGERDLWQVAVTPTCPPDINGDGIVDVLDLLELLAAWGPCP
jgi:Tol biopolymer transport system component